MAFAEVGSGSQRAILDASWVASATVAFPGNVTAGSLLIVAGTVSEGSGSTPITSVSITKSSGSATIGSFSYILGTTLVDSYKMAQAFIGYGLVTGSGSLTLLCDPTPDGYMSFAIDEFSGVDTTTPLDVNGGEAAGGPTGSPVVDTITTLAAGDLLIGAFANNVDMVAPDNGGSGWTDLATVGSGRTFPDTDYCMGSAMFKIVGAAGSYNVDWSWGGGNIMYAIVNAAFKVPAAVVNTPAWPARAVLRW